MVMGGGVRRVSIQTSWGAIRLLAAGWPPPVGGVEVGLPIQRTGGHLTEREECAEVPQAEGGRGGAPGHSEATTPGDSS